MCLFLVSFDIVLGIMGSMNKLVVPNLEPLGLAGEQESNEKRCLAHTPFIHSGAFVGAGSL